MSKQDKSHLAELEYVMRLERAAQVVIDRFHSNTSIDAAIYDLEQALENKPCQE